MIYLDNAATTKPSPALAALWEAYTREKWYNPSALYTPALFVEKEITAARKRLCQVIGAPHALFLSGGTEAANMVAQHGWRKRGSKKLHFITSMYEHPCVYESFRALSAAGHAVDFVKPNKAGVVAPEDVAMLVREDTALVSILHVHNETGAINDIAAIAKAVKGKNPETLFYADGVQGFLHVPFSMRNTAVDYYAVSAHKVHGFKGTGALFFQSNTPLHPFILGGGQEKGLRGGTENTWGIFAFDAAVQAYQKKQAAYTAHMERLKNHLLAALRSLDAVIITPKDSAPHIVNAAFPGLRGEVLLHLLEADHIYIATGSACSSKNRTGRVHHALGYAQEIAESVVRISFCPENTIEEIDITIEKIKIAQEKFRGVIRR